VIVIAALAGLACGNSIGLDDAPSPQPSVEVPRESTSPSPVPQVARTSPTPFVVTTPLAVPNDYDSLGPVRFFVSGNPWSKNDKLRRTVPIDDFFLGGGRDGIPAILDPNFESTAQADEWLDPLEPVMLVEVGSDVRVYPVQILILHEVVNDVVDGQPVLITY
jgi:hypothetical protein